MFKMIVAHDDNFGISKNGKIPWRVPEDFKYFKNYTMDSICVMGRNTYLDILTCVKPGNKPLPGRQIIVLTSKNLDDVQTITKLKELTREDLKLNKHIIICGGKRLYEEAVDVLPIDEISCTEINGEYECDITLDLKMFSNFRIFKRARLENTEHFISIYKNIRS